jgi:PAS domain S-box-containing protein
MLTNPPLNSDQQMVLEEYENMSIDLKIIFESSYDVMFVADGKGTALRVSSACERLWGKKKEEFIGRNTLDFENEGVFTPSITRIVLEQKRKVSVVQKTCTGRTLMVVGTPVIDSNGNVTRIINASRDITEIDQLQNELKEMKEITERYMREIQQLKLQETPPQKKLIYRSKEMEHLVDHVKNIARYDSTVLITGESGVGKEIIASLLHEWSNRFDKPFIKINCGAIPESLMESELFGYEKGAFTGGNKEGKHGLFYAANQGTIFLDEVTEIPLPLQVKLLRVLQEGEIRRVGSIEPAFINVRIIAATNKNMEELIKQGRLREDLYYRLNVIPIEVPPLRGRKEDIPPLANFFTKKFNEQYGTYKTLSPETIHEILQHEWKGNVRELKNFIERILITSNSDNIRHNDVKNLLGYHSTYNSHLQLEILDDVDLTETLALVEKRILEHASKKYTTTVDIAKALNIGQSTVSKKLKKHRINLKN